MKKYKYIGGTECPEDLEILGYYNNIKDTDKEPIEVVDGYLGAIKTFPEDRVAVAISDEEVEVYEYEGEEHNHTRIKRCEHPEKYVQDLLDDLLIREVPNE